MERERRKWSGWVGALFCPFSSPPLFTLGFLHFSPPPPFFALKAPCHLLLKAKKKKTLSTSFSFLPCPFPFSKVFALILLTSLPFQSSNLWKNQNRKGTKEKALKKPGKTLYTGILHGIRQISYKTNAEMYAKLFFLSNNRLGKIGDSRCANSPGNLPKCHKCVACTCYLKTLHSSRVAVR